MSVASVATGIALIGVVGVVLGPHHYDHFMELRALDKNDVPMPIRLLAMLCLAFDVVLAVFIGLTFNNGDDIDEFLFGLASAQLALAGLRLVNMLSPVKGLEKDTLKLFLIEVMASVQIAVASIALGDTSNDFDLDEPKHERLLWAAGAVPGIYLVLYLCLRLVRNMRESGGSRKVEGLQANFMAWSAL